MTDGRNHCRADPPKPFIGKRTISAQVDHDDYRQLYELTMISGVSMQETIRRMIRAEFKKTTTDS